MSFKISLLSHFYEYYSRRSLITYFLITYYIKKETATQNNKVFIIIVQESYVDKRVRTCMLIRATFVSIIEATNDPRANTMIVFIVKNKNLSLVMLGWKIHRQLLTAINKINTDICKAPTGNNLPSWSLTCGKVNNTAPIIIPP
jgi:hypothetical protein